MTKKMVEKWDSFDIEYRTRLGDIIPILMKMMEIHGADAEVDDHVTVSIRCDRLETDQEYAMRLQHEELKMQRELEQYKKLKEKYGHLE